MLQIIKWLLALYNSSFVFDTEKGTLSNYRVYAKPQCWHIQRVYRLIAVDHMTTSQPSQRNIRTKMKLEPG
jgi:hypothetical protein